MFTMSLSIVNAHHYFMCYLAALRRLAIVAHIPQYDSAIVTNIELRTVVFAYLQPLCEPECLAKPADRFSNIGVNEHRHYGCSWY